NNTIPNAIGDLTMLLFLKAFSSGCTALTGIEAISDGVANFKTPATKNAKKVLYLLFGVVFVIFGGVSWLATIYHSVPTVGKTSLSQIAVGVFGNNSILFFLMQFATTLILTIAANTAFSDFPLLLSFIARDGYAPRQFSKRGDRLSFSNGIIFLAIAAGSLVLIFDADNHALLPLYAVGVFISFTLSQTGMVIKWCREKTKGWHYKAAINGIGATVTFITSIVIFLNKFVHGAWIVSILIVVLICAMKRVKSHYTNVAKELSLESEYFPDFDETIAKRFIVPVDGLNKSVIKTLNYSKCLSNNITALHISVDSEATNKLKEKWEKHKIDIPLVIKHCEYRNVIRTLIDTIDSNEFKKSDKDIITVVLPEFTTKSKWQIILHNQTSLLIKRLLLKRAHIAVISTPFVINE
ncbi:MAG: APC family permease, partial [Sarcina sp.]